MPETSHWTHRTSPFTHRLSPATPPPMTRKTALQLFVLSSSMPCSVFCLIQQKLSSRPQASPSFHLKQSSLKYSRKMSTYKPQGNSQNPNYLSSQKPSGKTCQCPPRHCTLSIANSYKYHTCSSNMHCYWNDLRSDWASRTQMWYR